MLLFRKMKDGVLHNLLRARKKNQIIAPSRIPAAVLVPIYTREDEDYILFIRRTETVRKHRGEISFPGGAWEAVDRTLASTALRESWEEIGMMQKDVKILGELDDTETKNSNYIISPFLGIIPYPYEFKLDQWETDEIIEVPITDLMNIDIYHEEIRVLPDGPVNVLFYQYQGRTIWGATAKILHQFLEIYAEAALAPAYGADSMIKKQPA